MLFITVGTPSDHGPSDHPYAGTIIQSRADGTEKKVFARGFRNPFGIAFGPDGELFVTDNDSASNSGDEINHVRYGSRWTNHLLEDDHRDIDDIMDEVKAHLSKVRNMNVETIEAPY